MKYKIVIRPHGDSFEALLLTRLVFLWFFHVWILEEGRRGCRDEIFPFVAEWVDEYYITPDDIDDRTEVLS